MRVRISPCGRIEKPWGHEVLVAHTEKYALKHIFIRKGTRSSLQAHRQKLETILVMEGVIELEVVDPEGQSTKEVYRPGEAYTIPTGTPHRVTAIEDCRLIEASTPELNDVIRIHDDFGRAE